MSTSFSSLKSFCKSLMALSLYPWHVFWRAKLLGSTRPNICHFGPLCHLRNHDALSFPSFHLDKNCVRISHLLPVSRQDVFPITKILMSSGSGLTVIFPTLPHELNFFTLIKHYTVILNLDWLLGHLLYSH